MFKNKRKLNSQATFFSFLPTPNDNGVLLSTFDKNAENNISLLNKFYI